MEHRLTEIRKLWVNEVKPYYKKELIALKSGVPLFTLDKILLGERGTEANLTKVERTLRELISYARQ